MAPRWLTLAGLVMLIALAGVAFIDYEIIRADADAARVEAEVARAGCLYGSPAFTIAERKRRHARCDRLPGPLPERDRVERRWDQHGPWYAFAAAAIFLPTAVMFARLRRRVATSRTVDPSTSGSWRVTTIAVEVWVGIAIWLGLLYLVVDRWDEFVEATGGTTAECGAGSHCGVLGEFTEAHPLILLLLMLVGAAIPACAVTWLLGRLFRFLGGQRNGPGRLQFRETD